MSQEAIKEALCINHIVGQKTDTIIVEEDFVVPDIKPDILNVINTSGIVCINKKDIMDGKIKIDGCINSYIMYLADDEQSLVRSLNVNLDFSQIVDFEVLRIGMILESQVCIKQIECRVLNGRKINVRAILDINLEAYSNENLEFINNVENVRDVQLLRKECQINSLLGTGNTKVYAKDTIMIEDIDDLAEIMKVNIDIKNKETKISYNKILIKADGCIKIMYLTTDNRICCKNASIPIMGFIDMSDITDENICDVNYEIKNVLIKPNSIEEHSIYVEIEIEATCNCYQNKSFNLIDDLYSPSENLVYNQRTINTMSQRQTINDIYQIREKQEITEIGSNQIYDVDIRPYIISQTISNDKILYQGEIEVKFLFMSQNNISIDVKNTIIPFEYSMNVLGINKNTKVNTQIEVNSQDIIIMQDSNIDIKIDLQFIVETFNNEDIKLINDITIEENRDMNKYSVIIYFVKPGDTLWKIAKKFRSTIDSIATLNGVQDEKNLQIGEQLFIPI